MCHCSTCPCCWCSPLLQQPLWVEVVPSLGQWVRGWRLHTVYPTKYTHAFSHVLLIMVIWSVHRGYTGSFYQLLHWHCDNHMVTPVIVNWYCLQHGNKEGKELEFVLTKQYPNFCLHRQVVDCLNIISILEKNYHVMIRAPCSFYIMLLQIGYNLVVNFCVLCRKSLDISINRQKILIPFLPFNLNITLLDWK